jgi:cyclopropane-fatty-acyl-phospholipid synthase
MTDKWKKQLFIQNRTQLANATTLTSSLSSTLTALARSTNTLSNALLNVSAHYDISNEMFAAFLSPDMTYSCPIWRPLSPSAENETETLEAAQMTKLHRFITNARIKPSDHVLEIGTGWGSFAIEAVRQTGCKVTSLTLSIEQKALAEKRIAALGLQDKIRVLLMDYRALPTPPQPYDKIISIEMLEAVGAEYLETYFRVIHRLLKKDGIAVFQCITMPECRYEGYAKGEDFIRKYIFPGGHLPSISQLVRMISQGSEGTLVVERVENIGGHYAKTLRLWRQDFMRNFEGRIRPALLQDHRDMGVREVEVFRRKWEVCFFSFPISFSIPVSFFFSFHFFIRVNPANRDLKTVLLYLLRSRFREQDSGGCDYYCGEGGRDGVDGGDSFVISFFTCFLDGLVVSSIHVFQISVILEHFH